MPTKNQIKDIVATISDAEIEVLKHLWDTSPLSANDIIERSESDASSHPRTIKTLINRLLNKGALKYEEKNRMYLYFPVISKSDFYRLKAKSFLNKFFGGEISPLISMFSQHGDLSEKELVELRQLIEKLEKSDD